MGVQATAILSMRTAYLTALRDGAEDRAADVVVQARAAGLDATGIYVDVFQPALTSIGELWQRNEILVAEEHRATAITRALMAELAPHFRPPLNPHGRRVLLTCVAGETHDVGLQMVADVFRHDGWDVLLYGANMPTDDLMTVLARQDVALLGLSVTTSYTLLTLQHVIRTVRARQLPVTVAVGGQPFRTLPDLWLRVGADFCGRDARDALYRANRRWSAASGPIEQP